MSVNFTTTEASHQPNVVSSNQTFSAPQIEALELMVSQPDSSSELFIPPPSNVRIPLDQLIQGKSGGEMATHLSRHWLKDAATRIFFQPLRSFLELIVNSLDASVGAEKSVGKFGMGFISILTFLEHPETQGCNIHIETTTKESDKGLTSYSMDLLKEASYQVLFTDLEAQKETGTCITLAPKLGEFSKATLERLFQYCQTLQFYEHGKIEVDYEGVTYVIGEGPEVLAWVSLKKDGLRVRDQGCGITKKVACKKLFVPSSSTKIAQNQSTFPLHLPEFKKFSGKKGNDAHFLISINGVIVIDFSLPGCKENDLLLKMPPSTKLTLARDAIENRPATIHYLKQVIELTIHTAFKSEEAASRLLLLYKALKAWEDQVPSIAEAKLSTYLEATVHSALKGRPELIPYPQEYAPQFRALLPLSTHLIAFPSQLLMDHFESFEHFLFKEVKHSRKDLIASKTIFFIEGVKQVSSFGLRNCVFAPLSFLDANPSKEQLQFRLVSQFADDGKFLEISQANSSVPESIANLRSIQSEPFVVITGRDSEPDFYDNIPIDRLGMFQDVEDAPFLEFWQKHADKAVEFGRNRLFSREDTFCTNIAVVMEEDVEFHEQSKNILECTIVYHEGRYWYVQDPKAAWSELLKKAASVLQNETVDSKHYTQLESILASDFKPAFLKPLTPTEVSKLFFSWLIHQLGKEGMVYTTKEILWPVKEITTAYLESCFQTLSQKKTFVASRSLSTLDSQLDVWQGLESFMDYPDHLAAIKVVLPLLLFQKELLKKNVMPQQQEKLKQCVRHLLACYHRFFTIKLGEVPIAYGTTLPPMQPLTYNFPEVAGSVPVLVELVKSLSSTPHLFEKCLDLLAEEMQVRLDVEKRNKLMAKSLRLSVPVPGRLFYVYAESICFSTAISYLSLAKARGVDPYFIETLLHYVRTPFELTVMCFLLLSKDLERHFVNPPNKEKIAQLLIYFITVYLQQKNEPTYEEIYEDDHYYYNSMIKELSRLINPMVSYLEEIDGVAFDIDPQMTQAPIVERLHSAKEFTTIQVIHAAKNGNDFSKALKEGDLSLAVEAARKESKKTELQMVTQAVEHGSERSGVAATLTEAFQNSVDAQRGYLKKHPEAPQKKTVVSFDVRLVDPKDPHLLLEIADHIGMPNLETLLADFLIPNYSKKGNNREAVGEMGNGSYQMYREAEMVTVKTRTLDNPSRVYFLRIVPIRDPHTYEVIDLSHKCIDITDITETEFEGTTLRVLMKKKEGRSQMSMEVEGMGIRQFISETFSVAHPPLGENHALQCALKLPNGKQKPLQEIKKEYVPFKIPDCPFTCYKMTSDQTPGYVLTDGYPFKSLRTFLTEENILPPELVKEVDRGWCLNLPKGSYLPVQSRTRVQMTQETKKQLQRFLLEWIYLRSCTGEKTGPTTRYYPHMQAGDSNFSQMFPTTQAGTDMVEAVLTKGDRPSLETFFVHYQPTFLQLNFLGHIKTAYKNLVSALEATKTRLLEQVKTSLTPENRTTAYDVMVRKFKTECEKVVKEWKANLKGSNPNEQLFFDHVLKPWFENKVNNFIKYPPTLNDLVTEHKHLQSVEEKAAKEIKAQKAECKKNEIKEHLATAAAILSHYCILYSEHTPMKAPKPPTVRFTYTKMKNFSAYYTKAANEIVVNLAYNSLSEILKLGLKIALYEPIKDDALISISYRQSGTLNHELEHARRCQDCHAEENVHGYDSNHEGKYIDFEACAASWAKRAHQLGLFDRLAELLQQLVFPSEQALEKLRKIEKEHPELLLEAL